LPSERRHLPWVSGHPIAVGLTVFACMGTASCELLFSNSGLGNDPAASPAPSGAAGDAAPPPETTLMVGNADANTQDPASDADPTGSDVVPLSSDGPAVEAQAAPPEAQPEAQPDGMGDGASDDATVNIDAGARVAFVQMATATPTGANLYASAAFPTAQSAGDLNVVVIGWGDSTDSVMRVTDTAGNTYDLAIGPTRATGVSQSIYYAKSIVAAAANAVRVQFKVAVPKLDLRVVEYAELDPVAPLDTVAGQSGFSGAPTSGTAATHTAGEMIFGAGTTTDTFSYPGLTFTLRVLTANGNLVEDRPAASVGQYSADAVMTNQADWVMQVVTFRRR